MKTILIFTTLIIISLSRATNRSQSECVERSKTPCDKDCLALIERECGERSIIRQLGKCKFIDDEANIPKRPDQPWPEQYGSNFHGCLKSCITELEGDALMYM